MQVELSAQNRQQVILVPPGCEKMNVKVSREKCHDVLVVMIDHKGNVRSKPLHKVLPFIKDTHEQASLRFTMNNFSTKPISIELIPAKQ